MVDFGEFDKISLIFIIYVYIDCLAMFSIFIHFNAVFYLSKQEVLYICGRDMD